MMAVQAQVSPVITERRNSMIAKTCACSAAGVPPPRLSARSLSHPHLDVRHRGDLQTGPSGRSCGPPGGLPDSLREQTEVSGFLRDTRSVSRPSSSGGSAKYSGVDDVLGLIVMDVQVQQPVATNRFQPYAVASLVSYGRSRLDSWAFSPSKEIRSSVLF